jgi:hypothetical protein
MKLHTLNATLMAAGLLTAAPAFAQSSNAQKQPTQEGGGSGLPCGSPFNASPLGDPNYAGKQRTQEGGPSMPGPIGSNFNADPTYNPYKQHTQNLTHVDLGEAAGKAK